MAGDELSLKLEIDADALQNLRLDFGNAVFGGKIGSSLMKLGVTSMALQSILGVSTFALSILKDMSKMFSATLRILGMAISTPLRIIADLLGALFLPLAIGLLKIALPYWKAGMKMMPMMISIGADIWKIINGTGRVIIGLLKMLIGYYALQVALATLFAALSNPLVAAIVGVGTGIELLTNGFDFWSTMFGRTLSGVFGWIGSLFGSGLQDIFSGTGEIATGLAGLSD